MIAALEVFFAMRARHQRNEFFVRKSTFRQVLRERRTCNEHGKMELNMRQESTKYQYIHTAYLGGIRFIHTSEEMLSDEGASISE